MEEIDQFPKLGEQLLLEQGKFSPVGTRITSAHSETRVSPATPDGRAGRADRVARPLRFGYVDRSSAPGRDGRWRRPEQPARPSSPRTDPRRAGPDAGGGGQPGRAVDGGARPGVLPVRFGGHL